MQALAESGLSRHAVRDARGDEGAIVGGPTTPKRWDASIAFVLGTLERSADFGDSLIAIIIELLKSVQLCFKTTGDRFRL